MTSSDAADAFAAFERAGWESGRASPYHRGLGAMTSRPIPALLDAAAVGTGSAVLDVATGPGYAAALAAERGAEVVAVDLSREMLDLAAKLHPQIEFRQAPVRAADEFRALLTGAGLGDPAVESVRFPHRIDDVHRFIADLIAGTVRMGVMLEAQPADVQARFRHGFAERVEGWRSGAGYELPCAIKVGSGTR